MTVSKMYTHMISKITSVHMHKGVTVTWSDVAVCLCIHVCGCIVH